MIGMMASNKTSSSSGARWRKRWEDEGKRSQSVLTGTTYERKNSHICHASVNEWNAKWIAKDKQAQQRWLRINCSARLPAGSGVRVKSHFSVMQLKTFYSLSVAHLSRASSNLVLVRWKLENDLSSMRVAASLINFAFSYLIVIAVLSHSSSVQLRHSFFSCFSIFHHFPQFKMQFVGRAKDKNETRAARKKINHAMKSMEYANYSCTQEKKFPLILAAGGRRNWKQRQR